MHGARRGCVECGAEGESVKAPLKSQLHAMCVCMAARLEDCLVLLESQAEVCRATGYFDGARAVNECAAEARKIINEWEEL